MSSADDSTTAGTSADIPDTALPGAAAETVSAPPEPVVPEVPFGEWQSPITPEAVARSGARLAFTAVVGDTVWWQEGRPDEGGRSTVVAQRGDGSPQILLPVPWNTRTRVHEYGGRSYVPVPGATADDPWVIVFSNFADQRLYLAGPGVADGTAEPAPLTPDPRTVPDTAGSGTLESCALRFADTVLSPDRRELWCVQERHEGGAITRSIVAVPLDGSAVEHPEAIRTMVTGADFFAHPTPSPDGSRLAWISWNHPHMPWDGTELRVATITDGVTDRSRLLKGSIRESVLAPVWRDNASLYVATDWTGWWNIYQLGLSGEPPLALYPADEEFAAPMWQLGGRPFAKLADGRLAVVHGKGDAVLSILDPESCELTELETPFSDYYFAVAADGNTIAVVAGGPLVPLSVTRTDAATGSTRVLREEMSQMPDVRYLPVPRPVELEGPYGRVVHALVYPPTNPDAVGVAGTLPPYVVWAHGGPTAHVTAHLMLEKAYFTSRGIGVIDVNYGGSTGYGRSYRERLRRQWGVVDVEDAMAAATSLAAAGEADRDRLAIRGESAGGWTTLASITTGAIARGPVFAAAASYFGVSDLRGFAAHTHDFESRYLDGLIGPLPGFETVYVERAPVGHVTKATSPVLLLQGLDDPVVPPVQSESIAADLQAEGIRHCYLAFEGESHGFRKTESVVAAVQAELSFYGQILGFDPPGVPRLKIWEPGS